MKLFSRETWFADALVLLGLVLLGVAIWLWLGVAPVVGYAGVAALLIGLALALAAREETP
jgi:uncharacterized membrane protein